MSVVTPPPTEESRVPRPAAPSPSQRPRPARFDAYRDYGLTLGFRFVFSGPFVRSSYMADHVSQQAHVTTR